MPASDEFFPDSTVIQKIVEKALLPVIDCCEETFDESLEANLFIVVQDKMTFHLTVTGAKGPTAHGTPGEIHLICRKTNDPQRSRFQLEAVFKNLKANLSGFSGFSAKGDVKISGAGEIDVVSKGGVYRSNVWEFRGWI